MYPSVCLGWISSKTAEPIWLKICIGMEVCPETSSCILVAMALAPAVPPGKLKFFVFLGQLCFPLAAVISYSFTRWQHSRINSMVDKLCQSSTDELVVSVIILLHTIIINPSESRGNYSATSNNMKSVHWPLMGGCYIWYSEDGTGRGHSPLRPFLAVQNVTAHPSMARVPITIALQI